jgi:hypothetical protein
MKVCQNSLVFLLLTWMVVVSSAQQRKPSTPEDRAKGVQLARNLEVDPVGKQARKSREWLEDWLIRVSDIYAPGCSSSFLKDKSKFARELSFQIRASGAAFTIEHPDQADDPDARFQ